MADCDYCHARNHALCVPGNQAAYIGGAGPNVKMGPCSCKRRGHRPRKNRRTAGQMLAEMQGAKPVQP